MDLDEKVWKIKDLNIKDVFKEIYPKDKIFWEYDPFKKRKVYRAYCKFFKQEGSPSMYLDETFFACYDCGHRGTNIDFLRENMEISDTDIRENEVIKKLGKLAGIEFSQKEINKINEDILLINKSYPAQSHVESNLMKGTAIFFSTLGDTSKKCFIKNRGKVWQRYINHVINKNIPKIKIGFKKKKDPPF